MFRAIMTSCSLAVRTMRACAQGPPPEAAGEFGGGTPEGYVKKNKNTEKKIRKALFFFKESYFLLKSPVAFLKKNKNSKSKKDI